MKTPTNKRTPDPNYRQRVYRIVRRIPRGKVMTYGQIAYILGEGYTPRTVGFVMHSSDGDLPWHRVINSQGRCSTGRIVLPADKQQRMLEAEGVKFNEKGSCELPAYLWHPAAQKKAQTAATNTRTKLYKRSARRKSK